jgi:hypothetical protein
VLLPHLLRWESVPIRLCSNRNWQWQLACGKQCSDDMMQLLLVFLFACAPCLLQAAMHLLHGFMCSVNTGKVLLVP